MAKSAAADTTKVLVTGASGYVATHCVQQLLQNGYRVRGTVRNLQNMTKIQPLKALDKNDLLELVEADLEKPDDWPNAVKGCTYILHVASPFPIVPDASIIKTAIEGTLNVLRAANKCDTVRKVVLTSSCAAINEGHEEYDKVFNEEDWSNLDNPIVNNYGRSKTLAEKAAWDFWKNIEDGNKFDLTVLNPVLVVGPALMDVEGASITVVKRFLNREMPAVPRLQLALVDVRDVAKAHVLAMTEERSNGRRILLTYTPSYWFMDIARVLAKEFGPQGYYVSTIRAPYALVWLVSRIDKQAKSILPRINHEVKFDNTVAKDILGLEFTSPDKSLIDMAYSMIERGILPKKPKYKPQNAE
uniref:NAD-dependent epimerase/dehydratase domain-containing protein n=1 Tax=Plectus sambesii TaxID=2011161 RepID=A0A914XGW9_9BILA